MHTHSSSRRLPRWSAITALFGLAMMLAATGCSSTRAERLVSVRMTGPEVRRVLGEPYSQNRVVKDGVPVDVWLFREVQSRRDGSKTIVDSAVTLRDHRVVDVTALTSTPTKDAAIAPAEVLGAPRP